MLYEVNPFFVSVDTKMISPHNEWYIENVLVYAHFSSKLAFNLKEIKVRILD